ncbi:hypothetical protein HU200_063416 [Digitaria exilis]|uniref:Uncharacterized protein n=1 Tax=Digitaria exilis TaxID=1010633 RepID=A0A835ABB2_9POAL|nr:hypothetical protein HU200_063416 [Digitaria exilis]
MSLPNVSRDDVDEIQVFPLTEEDYNCAFPSSNAEGTKLVFRSSRDRVKGGERKHKNLFVIDAVEGETAGVHQITDGPWTDTHCSWSPREGCDWIVFSSSGRPEKDIVKRAGEPELDHGLDPGYFAVYLVSAKDIEKGKIPVPVRVIHSAPTIAGHVNHPVFSPDMRSIVFAADLAAVSADPISMPHFTHSVRPYGDIFSVDLRDNSGDITKNKDIQDTPRRHGPPSPTGDEEDPNAKWKMLASVPDFTPHCPYMQGEAGKKETTRAGVLAAQRLISSGSCERTLVAVARSYFLFHGCGHCLAAADCRRGSGQLKEMVGSSRSIWARSPVRQSVDGGKRKVPFLLCLVVAVGPCMVI